jgi:uncharacterized radical SAM protein YgiQ
MPREALIMFIPTTMREASDRGWDRFDVILVNGDTYIDTPSFGPAVIGHLLIDAGYRVGIIAQPDIQSGRDITRLGEPLLFWGVSSGAVDSLVSNYTATRKKRTRDDLTPGGKNMLRPDRAVISYVNHIRRYFKNTAPIVIGGIEASLRRIAHYDYHDDAVRRSVLFDSKADVLVFGMGERAVLELADHYASGRDFRNIRGVCYIGEGRIEKYLELAPFETVSADKNEFLEMFRVFSHNSDSNKEAGFVQKHGNRYLVHNPSAPALTVEELDHVFELPYEYDAHPFYKKMGGVRALDTVRFSITTHRGCFGGCNYCAIAAHQGKVVTSRSEASILKEVRRFMRHPSFKGVIPDVGGPTANMYGMQCRKTLRKGPCPVMQCLIPGVCGEMKVSHRRQIDLLRRIRNIPGIEKAFIASGIRYDLVLADSEAGEEYLADVVRHHVSGQLKVAPEHSVNRVLDLMARPPVESLISFKNLFNSLTRRFKKRQYLTFYLIAAHPGCGPGDMSALKKFTRRELRLVPEQVQIFTPTPSTWSTLMYYTGIDPFTGRKIFVERNNRAKQKQKNIIQPDTRTLKGKSTPP